VFEEQILHLVQQPEITISEHRGNFLRAAAKRECVLPIETFMAKKRTIDMEWLKP